MEFTFWIGLLIGLLVCAVDGHLLRIITLKPEEKFRIFVATSASVIYSLAIVAICLNWMIWGKSVGLLISIIFPLVGSLSIIFNRNTSIDLFQIALGIPQLAGMIIAALILFGVI